MTDEPIKDEPAKEASPTWGYKLVDGEVDARLFKDGKLVDGYVDTPAKLKAASK